MQVNSPKAAGHNGCQQIICPRREMRVGLKILASAPAPTDWPT